MTNDILSPALLQSMTASFSVTDLIKTAETLKRSGQTASIETVYAAWLGHHPDDPLRYAVLFNYSVALQDVGKLDAARECLEQAIAQHPEFMPAYINLGRIYERQGKIGLAVIQWSAGLAKMGGVTGTSVMHKTTALNQSARALEALSQDESAENMLRESLELDRQQREVIQHLVALRQRQCEWPVLLPSERVDRTLLLEGMSPLSAGAFADDPVLQLAIAARYNLLDVGQPEGAHFAWPKALEQTGKLRIGYLSSDMREHAMGYLMTEIFGLHDRSKVEVHAYYCGIEATDDLHAKYKAEADHWTSISHLDDAAAAQKIVDDGIHILVDCNGYTRDARLKLIALRPAPVIINWLGYPGTMASPYHHYIIADDWIIPKDHELYYTEEVLRLPCYQPSNRTRTVAPERPTRAEAGLPEGAMVYCCFNGLHKVHRFTFERWLSILAEVPGSVLWLLGGPETVEKRLRDYAAGRGIAGERLVFAPKVKNPNHLARYPLADLFLDTTPYGAHTTASDALWMGVPVLTLSGRSFASRVCGSLVRAAGLPEMVCETPEAFIQRAVAFGKDPEALRVVREKLRDAHDSCVLFNMPLLVGKLEELYAQAFEAFKAGRLPRPDLTNLDAYLEVATRMDHEALDVQSLGDYHGWWSEHLAKRHRQRPLSRDHRLVTDVEKFPGIEEH